MSSHDATLAPSIKRSCGFLGFFSYSGFPTVFLVIRISVQKQWRGVLGIAYQLKQFQLLFSQLYFHPSVDPPLQLFQVSGKSVRINEGKTT